MEMVGFRYDPTDEVLMKILMKVNNAEQTHLNHHFNFIVNDSEIYGKIPPWEIYDSHNHYHLHTFHRKLYVFTDLKTTTGNRVCRAAACGDIPTKQAIAPTVSLSLRLRLRLKIPSFCLCIFIDNCVFFFEIWRWQLSNPRPEEEIQQPQTQILQKKAETLLQRKLHQEDTHVHVTIKMQGYASLELNILR